MKRAIGKLAGDRAALPPKPPLRNVALAWLGGFLAIATVALLTKNLSHAFVLGSFGASCVLVFGFPDAPFSQPRNVIGGHALCSCVGLLFLTVFGPHWWAMAAAVGTVISLMMWLRIVHPPAGSNPVIIFLVQPSWGFLLFPTVLGALAIVVVALLYNNAVRESRYPKYW